MPEFRDLKTNKRCASDIENMNATINTKKYILNIFKKKKMAENNLTYDGTFNGNILVVGQTRCGKTSFV